MDCSSKGSAGLLESMRDEWHGVSFVAALLVSLGLTLVLGACATPRLPLEPSGIIPENAQSTSVEDGVWVCTAESLEMNYVSGTSPNTRVEHVYELDERGNVIVDTYQVSSSGNTQITTKSTVESDEYGLALSFTDDMGNVATQEWEKDDSGRPIKATLSWPNGNRALSEYEYNEKGSICRNTYTFRGKGNGGPGLGSVTVFEYNDDGMYTKSTVSYPNGEQLETTYTYERDSTGKVVSCKSTTRNLSTSKITVEEQKTYEYDDNGNVVCARTKGTSFADDASEQVYESTLTYTYKYINNPAPWVVQSAFLKEY